MQISIDDQRGEVIERLQNWKWKAEPPECQLNSLVFGSECPASNDNPDTISCHECEVMAAKRLAELLMPQEERTVTIDSDRWCGEDDLHPYEWAGVFSCGHVCYSHYGPVAYCPDCGAKVVRDGE